MSGGTLSGHPEYQGAHRCAVCAASILCHSFSDFSNWSNIIQVTVCLGYKIGLDEPHHRVGELWSGWQGIYSIWQPHPLFESFQNCHKIPPCFFSKVQELIFYEQRYLVYYLTDTLLFFCAAWAAEGGTGKQKKKENMVLVCFED